jgi:hypothetical protein
MSLDEKHVTNKTQTTPTNKLLSLLSSQHLKMLKSPGHLKETSARWNEADRNFFERKTTQALSKSTTPLQATSTPSV